MVFAFIGILSITVIALLRSERQDKPVIFKNLKHLQLKYLAKGALQHARLKMRLLSTEAYDGAAYAVGKNPYFDHSSGYADFPTGWTAIHAPNALASRGTGSLVTNPGPAFLSGSVVNLSPLERSVVADTDFDNNPDPWSGGDYPASSPKIDKLFKRTFGGNHPARLRSNLYLVRFYEDISSLDPFSTVLPELPDAIDLRAWIDTGTLSFGPSAMPGITDGIYDFSQAAIRVVSGAADPVTGVPDLFTASYLVDEMKVLASRNAKLYGQEAISVSVEVRIVSQGFLSVASGAGSGLAAARFAAVSGQLKERAIYKVSRSLNN
jgi:hypothetical protein